MIDEAWTYAQQSVLGSCLIDSRAIGAVLFELSEDDGWMLSCMPQTTWLGEHPDFVIPTKKSNPDQ